MAKSGQTTRSSGSEQRTPEVEEVRPYVEGVAKNLIDKLYGPGGPAWGTKLTEIEDAASKIEVKGGRYSETLERMTNL